MTLMMVMVTVVMMVMVMAMVMVMVMVMVMAMVIVMVMKEGFNLIVRCAKPNCQYLLPCWTDHQDHLLARHRSQC